MSDVVPSEECVGWWSDYTHPAVQLNHDSTMLSTTIKLWGEYIPLSQMNAHDKETRASSRQVLSPPAKVSVSRQPRYSEIHTLIGSQWLYHVVPEQSKRRSEIESWNPRSARMSNDLHHSPGQNMWDAMQNHVVQASKSRVSELRRLTVPKISQSSNPHRLSEHNEKKWKSDRDE